LARNGEIVCRATTGENAPGLGVPLDTQSGLSAACVQTRKWQHCEDTDLDDRVDAEVCRELGVRSILVYPIVKKREVLGLIEIFSSRPQAFSSREVGTLEASAREVVESVDHAAAVQPSNALADSSQVPSLESLQTAAPPPKRRDSWNDALSLLVIALAVVLGWVMGRAGWRSTMTNSSTRGRQISRLSGSGAATTPAPSSGAQPQAESPDETSAVDRSRGSEVQDSGLTVYQNGRVVFRASAPSRTASTTPRPPATTGQREESIGPPLRISPTIANEYVVRRVEPEYPDSARAGGIQGTVEMDVLVGQDGEVQRLDPVSGDPRLIKAAVNAVQQWRFQPFFRHGVPERFQTRITLAFRLP
jgi:TonB family protein